MRTPNPYRLERHFYIKLLLVVEFEYPSLICCHLSQSEVTLLYDSLSQRIPHLLRIVPGCSSVQSLTMMETGNGKVNRRKQHNCEYCYLFNILHE